MSADVREDGFDEVTEQDEMLRAPDVEYGSRDHARSAQGAGARSQSRAASVAMVGLSIAIMAICSWVTIPLGPIPFTLQMFAIPLALFVLRPSQAVCAVLGYLVLGAIGVPVFSGMRGGIGVFLGPTGGFLIGYLPGTIIAAFLLYLTAPVALRRQAAYRKRNGAPSRRGGIMQRMRGNLFGCIMQLVAGLSFVFVAYMTGWAQFMLVAQVGPEAAFIACVAPFIVPDVLKVIAAVVVAQPIRAALRRS